jgi:beta-glucosidase
MKGENEMPIEEATRDLQRINYYKGYLNEVVAAINDDGIDISGYFAWSLAE